MKLYIAGPMTGYPKYNYPAFDRADEILKSLGYETLNPTHNDLIEVDPPSKKEWDFYMRCSIRQVLDADGIAVLDGWQLSRGARLEVEIGLALQLPILTFDQWIEKGMTARAEAAS